MRKQIFTLFLLAAAPLAAQEHQHPAGATLPSGWHVRADRANAPLQKVKFVQMGNGYHATLGPSVLLYNPAQTAQGSYRAHATFTQTKATPHPEGYGLVVGGKNLAAENQDYLYFLVRQDGKFMVKHRAGTETHTLFDWTAHPAIKPVDAQGKATNALAIDVTDSAARFLVNGQEVAKVDRTPAFNTDGIVGLRINHNLDVHVADWGIDQGGNEG